ncbi:hypothetical protein D3C76_1391760 [compost metagenome]
MSITQFAERCSNEDHQEYPVSSGCTQSSPQAWCKSVDWPREIGMPNAKLKQQDQSVHHIYHACYDKRKRRFGRSKVKSDNWAKNNTKINRGIAQIKNEQLVL